MKVVNQNGISWIDRASDERFRHMLIHGAPAPIGRKIKDALSRAPKPNAREYSEQHFGARLPGIIALTRPLMDALEAYFEAHGAPGLTEWMRVTGYGDDYRTINAFAEWAAMAKAQAKTPHATIQQVSQAAH